MSCRSELRGLGAVSEELAARGGVLLAVSVDTPEESRALAQAEKLPFRILADTTRDVLRRYGLLHAGGGPGGADIAVPALFLVRPDGRIAWRHIARRVQDRADPQEIQDAIAEL
jgi:peroxiredoxin